MKMRAIGKMAIVGIVVVVVIIAAAGYVLTITPSAPVKQMAVVFDVGGRGDLSFNDMAYLGAERAKKDFGVNVTYVQSRVGADYLPNLRNLASTGKYSLIVAIGFLLTDALNQTAQEFPNQNFAIIDGYLPGMANVRSILFSEQDGSALVGLLAGLVTKTNKVGVVLGMDIPILYKFESGYYYGISLAENLTGKNIQIFYKYTGTFTDVATGKQVTDGFLTQGVDVVYNVAGLTGKGMLDAVADWGTANGKTMGPPYGIGVDSDQDWIHPGFVLASMMKRVDVGVYTAMRDANAGNFTGNVYVLGLGDGGNKLSDASDLGTFMDVAVSQGVTLPMSADQTKSVYNQMRNQIDASVWAKIADLQQKIASKQVVIPIPSTPAEIQAIRAQYGVTG